MAATLVAGLMLLLLSAGLQDVRTREIANWKNGLIAALAPFWWWAVGLELWPGVAVQLGVAVAVFGLFAAAFRLGMMGGGDVKMIAALALWFPFPALAQLLVVMSIAGGVITVLLMIERRWRKGEIEVPYGVAIAIAGLLSLREPILNHLQHT
ncbi:peptidase [Sphingomonas lenta]|uniref:Peptidase n=2 Tax=Sphingomonas lenta TaxID=1141887 RepID=A0A2A2SL73_9SPHN|nr:peptidase [Sphingomonas lenta]